MEIKIKDKKENVLFNRLEIQAEIEHFKEPTPNRAQVKEKLAAMLSVDVNLIVIKKLDQTYSTLTKCFAVVYKNKEDLDHAEEKHLVKRDAKKPKEEKKEEPAPAEAPKEEPKPEEKPAEEEKKEEPKPEEEKPAEAQSEPKDSAEPPAVEKKEEEKPEETQSESTDSAVPSTVEKK